MVKLFLIYYEPFNPSNQFSLQSVIYYKLMQEEKHKYKAETLKLTTMLERTLKELAAIKKEHQRTVQQLNDAQCSRDSIIQILKKQVGHEIQQRTRLENENTQLYAKLTQLQCLPISSSRQRLSQRSYDPSDQQTQKTMTASMNRTISQLRFQIEALKTEKQDAKLKAEYECTIEYNKLRNQFKNSQERMMDLEGKVSTLEASRAHLLCEKSHLQHVIQNMKGDKIQDGEHQQVTGVDTLAMEMDKLRQQCQSLRISNEELQAAAVQYESIISEYRTTLDEAKLQYDNRELQFLREKNNDRFERDLLRAQLEKAKLNISSKLQDAHEYQQTKIRELEKKVEEYQIQNSELMSKIQELLENQRTQLSRNQQNADETSKKKLIQKDQTIQEYRQQCQRLTEINMRLSQDLNKTENQQTRLKTSRAVNDMKYQKQVETLEKQNGELKRSNELLEMQTKQELSRLHEQVQLMVEADEADRQMIESLKNDRLRLQAQIQRLTTTLTETQSNLSNARAQKIRLSTEFQEAASQLNASRIKCEKLGRQLQAYICRERSHNKLIEDMKETIVFLEQKTTQIQVERQKYTAAELQQSIRIQEVKQQSLLDSKEESLIDTSVFKNQNEKLIQANKQLELQKADFQEQLNRKRQEIQELQKQQKAIIIELEKIRQSSQQLRIQMTVEQSNAVARNIEAQRNVSQMSLELHSLKQQNNQLLRERDDYALQCQQKQALITNLEMKLGYIQNSLQSLRNEYEFHQEQALATNSQLQSTKLQIQLVSHKLEQQQIKCSSLQKVVVEKQKNFKKVQQEANELLKEKNLQIQKLQDQLLHLNNELQLIKMEKQAIQHEKQTVNHLKKQLQNQKIKVNKLEDKQCQQNIIIMLKESQFDQNNRKYDILLSENTKIQGKSQQLQQVNKRILNELIQQKESLLNKQKQICQQKQHNKDMTIKIISLQQDIQKHIQKSSCLMSIELHQQKIKNLIEQNHTFRQQLAKNGQSFKQLYFIQQQLKVNVISLQQQLKQKIICIQKKDLNSNKIANQLLDITRNRDQLQLKVNQQSVQIRGLNDNKNLLMSENVDLKESIKKIPQLINNMKHVQKLYQGCLEQSKKLQEREAQLHLQNNQLKKINKELRQKNQEFEEKLNSVTNSANKKSKQLKQLQQNKQQLQSLLNTKQLNIKQIQKQKNFLSTQFTNKINDLKHELQQARIVKDQIQSRCQKLIIQNSEIKNTASSDHQISEMLMVITQLRTQNQRLQLQLMNMYSQQTIDQIKSKYELDIEKQRMNSIQLSKNYLEAQSLSRQLKMELDLLLNEKASLQQYKRQKLFQKQTALKQLQLMKNKIETQLNNTITDLKKQLNNTTEKLNKQIKVITEERDELKRKLEQYTKQMMKQEAMNKKISSKVQIYEKQLRMKDEVTRKWFSDKQKALTNLTVENERFRVEMSKNEGGSSEVQQFKHVIETLKVELDKKSKIEIKLANERKQLKEQVFCVRRQIDNLKDDLNFERKRNNHLEELYSKYRSVKNVSSDSCLDPKSKPSSLKVQMGSAISIDSPNEQLNPASSIRAGKS